MLSGIAPGNYLEVTGLGTTHISKNYNGNQFMTGDMRYDLDSQCIKVFDGMTWQTLSGSYPSINLTSEAQELLDWARQKRREELEIKALAATNPALKDAVEALQRAQEQVKIIAALVQE